MVDWSLPSKLATALLAPARFTLAQTSPYPVFTGKTGIMSFPVRGEGVPLAVEGNKALSGSRGNVNG
jgi:hypothetical protein